MGRGAGHEDQQGLPGLVRRGRGGWWHPWQQPPGRKFPVGLRCLRPRRRQGCVQVHVRRGQQVPPLPCPQGDQGTRLDSEPKPRFACSPSSCCCCCPSSFSSSCPSSSQVG